MAEHENILLRKIGPLPAIAWSGIIAGVYVAYKWATVNRHPTQSSTESASELPSFPGDGTSDDPGYGNAAGSYSGSTATPPYSEPVIADNLTWARRAINWLIAQGIDPGTANTAIYSYINQDGTLNSSQYAAWLMAFTHFGNPPDSTLPTPSQAPDSPATPPPPPPPDPESQHTGTHIPGPEGPPPDPTDPNNPKNTPPPTAPISCPPGWHAALQSDGMWYCVPNP